VTQQVGPLPVADANDGRLRNFTRYRRQLRGNTGYLTGSIGQSRTYFNGSTQYISEKLFLFQLQLWRRLTISRLKVPRIAALPPVLMRRAGNSMRTLPAGAIPIMIGGITRWKF
jgi:hypothetical protein